MFDFLKVTTDTYNKKFNTKVEGERLERKRPTERERERVTRTHYMHEVFRLRLIVNEREFFCC